MLRVTTNPEQEARAAVTTAMSEHHAYHCTPTERLPSHAIKDCPAIMPALDRLCTERYLAGSVEKLRFIFADLERLAVDADVGPLAREKLAAIAWGYKYKLSEAEAEYAACVAALQEAKHG